MTSLSLQNVTKRYTTDQAAVDRISLDVQPGELLALLGPSGCGKTTTLRMITGLIRPDSGDILYDGHSMLAVPPQKRGAVMVFQQDTLFPFRSVGDNVAFGLRFQKQKPTSNEIKTQVANALKAVQLAGYESRYPAQLSGGQRQRVALARALVLRPRLLLLDEPLSHLDEELRVELREMIRLIQQERQLTTIFVTHDQTEAVSIADRIAVMLDGRLQQTEMPQTFFRSPKTPEIARFFGWENIFTGIAKDGLLETDLGMLKCDVAIQTQRSNRYEWCIRPEAINIISADHAERQSSPNCFTGRVIAYRFFGDYAQVQAEFNGLTLFIKTEPFHIFRPGDQIVAQLPDQHIHIFV